MTVPIIAATYTPVNSIWDYICYKRESSKKIEWVRYFQTTLYYNLYNDCYNIIPSITIPPKSPPPHSR